MKFSQQIKKAVALGALGLMSSLGLGGCVTTTDMKQSLEQTVQQYFPDAVDKEYDFSPTFLKGKLYDVKRATDLVIGIRHYDVLQLKMAKEGMKIEETKKVGEHHSYIFASSIALKKHNGRLYLSTNQHVVETPFMSKISQDKETGLITTYKFTGLDTYIVFGIRKGWKEDKENFDKYVKGIKVKPLLQNAKLDFALLASDLKDFDKIRNIPTHNKTGNSDELKEGNWLYAVGYPYHSLHPFSVKISQGVIKGKPVPADPESDHNVIYMSNTILPGSSGGGVYALRDGKPELVGISTLGYSFSDGAFHEWGIKAISPIKDYLDASGYGFVLR